MAVLMPFSGEKSIGLGETSSDAYRGDRGKVAYDHSQSDHSDITPAFTEASTRTDIASGDSLATILGKIKKWFSSLKTYAFWNLDGDTLALGTDESNGAVYSKCSKVSYDSTYNQLTIETKSSYDTSSIATVSIPTKTSQLTNDSYITAGKKSGTSLGTKATAEGLGNTASGDYSHAENIDNTASGDYSHAEGQYSTASGYNSHAEGGSTKATAPASHSEGLGTEATGNSSHAEGGYAKATGERAHAEGSYTIASGYASHAEGVTTTAAGMGSHTEGNHTIANGEYQHVIGKYNVEDNNNTYVFIVGNGTANYERSNILTLDWNGNLCVTKLNGSTIGNNPKFTDTTYSDATTSTSGLMSASDKTKLDGIDTTINGKADKATTLSGYGITDAYTKTETDTIIGNLPKAMIFKGTLGNNGTITSLPTASSSNEGYTYKVISAGTYASEQADVGDLFTSNASSWVRIPSGDDTSSDTWRNIKVNDIQLLGNGISTGGVNFKSGTNAQVSGSGNDVTVDISTTFTEAGTRTNIASGDTIATILGKIKKWFSDLKTVAFTGNYSDLTGQPTVATQSASGLMSATDKTKLDGIASGAQVNSITGVKGNSETTYRTGNVNITKDNIGLGNVGNFKAVSTVASQGLTSTEQSNARANIGAGTSNLTIGTTGTTACAGNDSRLSNARTPLLPINPSASAISGYANGTMWITTT